MDDELQVLLHACKTGNEEKWNLLFAKCHPVARGLVRRNLRQLDKQTVDLIAQDVMLALHEKIQKINDVEHLGFFIKAVAHNKCVDYIRRNKLTILPITDDFPFVEEKVFLTDEKVEALHAALANLSQQESTLVHLRYMEYHSYKEIAARTGIDEAQVGMKLSRALSHLRAELVKQGFTSLFCEPDA